MRSLIANTFMTLDGVMQAPGGPEEDPSGGFKYGGWSVSYWDEAMGKWMDEFMGKPFDLLLGRRTYEIFAAHWPHAEGSGRAERGGDESPVGDDSAARVLNNARKYVASKTLDRVDWKNSTLLVGDVADAVAALKKQPGPEIQVHGSSNLLQTLIKHKLVDRFQVWIFPVLVGGGKRLFADGTVPTGLKLVDSKVSATGVFMAAYAPVGDVPVGSFAFEDATPEELERRHKLANE